MFLRQHKTAQTSHFSSKTKYLSSKDHTETKLNKLFETRLASFTVEALKSLLNFKKL